MTIICSTYDKKNGMPRTSGKEDAKKKKKAQDRVSAGKGWPRLGWGGEGTLLMAHAPRGAEG